MSDRYPLITALWVVDSVRDSFCRWWTRCTRKRTPFCHSEITTIRRYTGTRYKLMPEDWVFSVALFSNTRFWAPRITDLWKFIQLTTGFPVHVIVRNLGWLLQPNPKLISRGLFYDTSWHCMPWCMHGLIRGRSDHHFADRVTTGKRKKPVKELFPNQLARITPSMNAQFTTKVEKGDSCKTLTCKRILKCNEQ